MTRIIRPRWLALVVACLAVVRAPAEAPRTPCGDTQFATYKALYDYDANQPLNWEILETSDRGGTSVSLVQFDGLDGRPVRGYLLLPPHEGRLPLILTLHPLGASKEIVLPLAPALSTFGVRMAFLALDAQHHGERRVEGRNILVGDLGQVRDAFIQTVVDYRRALDGLQGHPELDLSRVGVAGMSMGAIMGSLLTAVDERIKTAVLAVGLADWTIFGETSPADFMVAYRAAYPDVKFRENQDKTDPIDPLHFAPRFGRRSVLLLNAREDEIIPRACGELLQAVAVGEPVLKEWYPGGHALPAETVALRIVAWFQEHLAL